MNINRNFLRRPAALVSALALFAAAAAPLVNFTSASAGQVTTRFIQLSNSTPSATGVTYNVSFKPAAASNIGGIVVDFCSDSPIIGSTTCAYPAAFDLGNAPVVSGLSGFSTSTGSWVTTNSLQGGASAGKKQTLLYTNATAQTPTGTGTAINFQITGVTNSSTTGSFYARILTFDTSANTVSQYTGGATTTRAASFANQIDYGGVALSTAAAINISASVMETLTFCVSKLAPGAACSGTSAPNLTLGHGSPLALDSSATDTDTAYTQLSTNANSGAVVTLKPTSSVACSGLSRDAGATCGIVANGTPASAIPAGTAAKFGLLVANGSGGTGTVTANTNYNQGAGTYGMGAITTYGDPIESSSGATANVNSLLTYAATAATTTPAGIYTATESLIATGTF